MAFRADDLDRPAPPEPVVAVTTPREQRIAAALALAALFIDTLLLVGVIQGVDAWSLVGVHALLVAAIGAWAWRHGPSLSRPGALLWVATLGFGPFGSGGVLLAMALEQHYARRATPVEEWHELLFPPPFVDPNAEIWRRVGQRASDRPADAQVTPFLDVLAFGSIPQRQAAIGIIAQQFHPAFAPALKTALRDEHNVVRVQAATAIARLENEFLARTIELEAEADAAPDDDAAALALARHYDAQAFGGLMDPGREQECRTRAADGYARHLQRHPDDDRVRFELARLRQRSGLWSEAEAHLRPLVARHYPSARLWLMENLFAQRRFTELREVAAAPAPPDGDAVVPEAALAVALWAGEASAT